MLLHTVHLEHLHRLVSKSAFTPASLILSIASSKNRNSAGNQLLSGTTCPTLLQNSHLAPLPPSQLSALTSVILFTSPGSVKMVIFSPLTTPGTLNGVPPVSLRLIWYGLWYENVGHELAGLVAVELLLAPLAMLSLILGSPPVMKFP